MFVGVYGHVVSETGQSVADVDVMVEGHEQPVSLTSTGHFYRLLAPGQYKLKAKSQGKSIL
jgi:predicted nucleotidyltransferase